MLYTILTLIFLIAPFISILAQGIQYRSNNPAAIGEWYFTNNPTVVTGGFFDTAKFWIGQKMMQLTRYDSSKNDGTPNSQGGMLWANSNGEFKRSPMSSIITSAAIIAGLGFTPANASDLSNYYLASNPNGYISGITSGNVTTALGFTPVTNARTITINGTTQDLSANRTWTIPTGGTYTAGTGININGSNVVSNTSPDQVISLTAGTGISITGSYPNFTITNTYIPSTNYSPGRSVNSNYTLSATRPVLCVYTFTASTTNPLLVGTSSANVYAEYSTNGGGVWNPVSQNGTSNGVGLTVTVALTVGQTSTMTFITSPNYLYRLRTVTSGTASVNLISQNETTL